MPLTRAELVTRRSSAMGRDPAHGDQEHRGLPTAEVDLQVAIEELYALATEAERSGLPDHEVARTWRGLGDAWFALARRGQPRLLENSLDAYRRGERMLTRAPDAIEGAELDLALAATLFELARGMDTGLLRRASDRLERSLAIFRRQRPARAEAAARALDRTRAALDAALAADDASDSISEAAQQIELLRLLQGRLATETAMDTLPPLRRVEVEAQLRAIERALSSSQRDGEAAHLGAVQARELFRWTRPRSSCGDPRLDWFDDALKAELPRPMRPQSDRETTRRLLTAARRLADDVPRTCRDGEATRAAWDAQIFHLAVAVQAHLRRFNVMLAAPAWPSAPVEPRPDHLFFAGRPELAERLRGICASRGLVLLCEPAERARSGELLWNHLRMSAGAVFDLGVAGGEAATSAYYGLALALTLGTSTALLAPRGCALPLEIEGCPLVRLGDQHDAARLDAVIDLAVCGPRWVAPAAGCLGEVVAELDRLYATSAPLNGGAARVESARRAANAADATACRTAVEAALAALSPPAGSPSPPRPPHARGSAGASGHLVTLSPWYAPTYPPSGSGPRRLLHATGARGLSPRATGAVESACVSRGFSHVRLVPPGAVPAAPRSLRALWRHVGAAHAILADVTDGEPLVALVIGLARACGKPVQIVAESSPVAEARRDGPEALGPLSDDAVSTWSDGVELHERVALFLAAIGRSEQAPAPAPPRQDEE